MDLEQPESISKRIHAGQKKVLDFEERKIAEWNRAVQQIEDAWGKIEAQVKALLPAEVREHFKILRSEVFSKIDAGSRASHQLMQEDIELLKTRLPEPGPVGKRGVIALPGLHEIIVTVGGPSGAPEVLFDTRENLPNSAEQDGSLEVALYFAGQSLEEKPHSNAFLLDEEEMPDA